MADEELRPSGDLVVVFRAPNEYTANLVRGLLIGEDIPATLKSRQVAWLDGVMTMGEGFWGDVMVPREYAERSRELIDAYKAPVEEQEQPQEEP